MKCPAVVKISSASDTSWAGFTWSKEPIIIQLIQSTAISIAQVCKNLLSLFWPFVIFLSQKILKYLFLTCAGSETTRRLGFFDVKTSPVHFYVQRSSSYSTSRTVLPWESAQLNLGNAMNLSTGVFTAPKDGVYHFHFTGVGGAASFFDVFLRLNGANVGYAWANSNQDSASLHSTLQLKNGDQIDLYFFDGILHDHSHHWSHFTGWLDGEDLQL